MHWAACSISAVPKVNALNVHAIFSHYFTNVHMVIEMERLYVFGSRRRCAGRLNTFSCHECVHLGDGSTELFEKRMLILFIIVYNRESVSVGRSAWFSRFLKIEFWTHGKVHDWRGGRRARARPRAFRKRAARERQIFVICRPPATMLLDWIVLLLIGIHDKTDTFDTPDQPGLMRHITHAFDITYLL